MHSFIISPTCCWQLIKTLAHRICSALRYSIWALTHKQSDMERVTATYDAAEQAWVTPEQELRRDIYLMITLKRRGKVVIRQNSGDGKWPRVPLDRHKDTKAFCMRMDVRADSVKIRIYTS